MSGLAGRLRERITVSRSGGGRDAIGGDAVARTTIGTFWAAIRPSGGQALAEGDARAALPLWALTARPFDCQVGDQLSWNGKNLIVRSVTADPTTPDRIEAIAEEMR